MDPNVSGKKKSIKLFLMIFCYTHRLEPSIIAIKEALYSSYGNRYRDPQPNTGQSSWTLIEELRGGLWALKGIGTPEEEQQPTNLDLWGFQRLNHQPKNIQRFNLGPLTYM